MVRLLIQPGQPGRGMRYDPLESMPYPWLVEAETGREAHDLFAGTLVGFQKNPDPPNPDRFAEEFVHLSKVPDNPEAVVGCRPVFMDEGQMYALPDVQILAIRAVVNNAAPAVRGLQKLLAELKGAD